jgi:hypothetical protein
MTFEIKALAWDRHKNVAGLNRLMGFPRYDYNLTITKSPKPATDNRFNEHFAL